MTSYRYFVHDLAKRCRDVLAAYHASARGSDREVTLLLMATTAGFVLPYERLTIGQGFKQPSLDRGCYTDAREQLQTALNERVADSPLFHDQRSWSSGILKSAHGTPDDWSELQKPPALQPGVQVLDLVRGIRHALAHGNILSQADGNGQISQLVFVSGGDRGIPARYVLATPSDLHRFLDAWFVMIEHLPLPYEDVLRVIGDAA